MPVKITPTLKKLLKLTQLEIVENINASINGNAICSLIDHNTSDESKDNIIRVYAHGFFVRNSMIFIDKYYLQVIKLIQKQAK